MSAIKRPPGEAKEDIKLQARREAQARSDEYRRRGEAAYRNVCTGFTFWTVCGHKECRRMQSCCGDANRCFDRCWPYVPEDIKTYFRAYITAVVDRKLSRPEAERHAEQEVVRVREMEARFAQQKVEQDVTAGPKVAPRAPRYVPEDRAPRIRRL